MYYAAYNSVNTDVAMFESKKERDEWVAYPYSAFERIAISAKDVFDIVGKRFETMVDVFGTKWLINETNINL